MDLGFEGSSVRIEVRMFGEFSITINGNTLTNLKGRTKRVWMLIQYLIAERSDPVPMDRLLKEIWDGRACGDPENALKNLVYRARTLLRGLSGDQSQFIVFLNGTYAWNNQYECAVDSEQFLDCCEKAGREKAPEKRIEWYRRAIALYRGGFLPKSAYSTWVILQRARYAEHYSRCVLELCRLLAERERYAEVVSACEAALRLFPYEEPMHVLLLQAYANLGRRSKAFDHYNRAVKMFYREFGVDLGDVLRPYSARPSVGSARPESDLETIRSDLREKTEARGAFFCDYDMFKCLYRSQMRIIPRTGHSVFLLLFSITAPDGSPPDPEAAKYAAEKLKDAVLISLRKGDAVASCSSTQFIAMLQAVTAESAQGVVQRILRRFRFEYRRDAVKIDTKITSLIG